MPDSVEQRLRTALYTYRGHSSWLEVIAWSPDSRRIASGSWDRSVQVWDAATGERVGAYRGHTKIVQAVAWSPDGTRIASADQSYPGRVQVWDAATGAELTALYGDTAFVYDLAWSPDGRRIASTGSLFERVVHIWDAQSGEQLLTYRGHANWVRYVDWSPDSSRVVSTSYDRIAQVWDAETGETLVTYEGHVGWGGVCSVAWSPDGTRIATAPHEASEVHVWNARTGKHLTTSLHGANDIAWSPDSRRIASASGIYPDSRADDDDEEAFGPPADSLTWKMMGGEKAYEKAFKKFQASRRRDPRYLHAKVCIAWQSDLHGPAVLVWDASTGADLFVCAPHEDVVKAVAWSPDGACIASASIDQTVQVYQVRELNSHT